MGINKSPNFVPILLSQVCLCHEDAVSKARGRESWMTCPILAQTMKTFSELSSSLFLCCSPESYHPLLRPQPLFSVSLPPNYSSSNPLFP